MAELEALLSALDAARDDFHDALAGVDAELVTVPGVVGEWSVRDLVVHVAAWDEHGTAALELATSGRGGDFAYSTADTDAENDRIEAEALRTSPSEALAREERAFTEFRAAFYDSPKRPAMINFIAGLGGREDTAENGDEMFRLMQRATAGELNTNVHWIGVRE